MISSAFWQSSHFGDLQQVSNFILHFLTLIIFYAGIEWQKSSFLSMDWYLYGQAQSAMLSFMLSRLDNNVIICIQNVFQFSCHDQGFQVCLFQRRHYKMEQWDRKWLHQSMMVQVDRRSLPFLALTRATHHLSQLRARPDHRLECCNCPILHWVRDGIALIIHNNILFVHFLIILRWLIFSHHWLSPSPHCHRPHMHTQSKRYIFNQKLFDPLNVTN